tara:strand:+ start:1384 stop:1566 length:183 start_codon:yes stop_codon:yes gene_type:complete
MANEELWEQNYFLGSLNFDDAAPSIITLSETENIITIDVRAVVYKKQPFEEIIDPEFKAY